MFATEDLVERLQFRRFIESLDLKQQYPGFEHTLGGSAEQLTALSRRLVDAQETERRELSRELHDRAGQNLTALTINLDILRTSLGENTHAAQRGRIDDSARLLERIADSIENVMTELRPPMLDDYGFLPALHWYARNFSERTGIDVHVSTSQPEMSVVGLAENGRDAVRCIAETCPDVVLMDHRMPVLSGTEATRLIRERCPNTRVIMLSMYSDAIHVWRALQAGANGYIVKKSVAKEVVEAIWAVHRGMRYISRQLTECVLDHVVQRSQPDDPLERLSSRERQVLQLLAEGHSIAEIAATLSLSPKTVETYRARMMEKLGIHELAGLVRFAIEHGVTSLE